jgi:hypothetical protein
MARYLNEWGVGAALDKIAVKGSAVNFRDGLGLVFVKSPTMSTNIYGCR